MGSHGTNIVQLDNVIFPGTPNNHLVINGCLVKQAFSIYIKIWNHSIETTIYKWLALGFQVHISLRILLVHPEEITPITSNHMNG